MGGRAKRTVQCGFPPPRNTDGVLTMHPCLALF